jgi:hypothetical protein
MDMFDEYRKCAEICSKKIDYYHVDKRTIRANNRAVVKMYKIVKKAVKNGDQAVAELVKLLDEPISAPWIAHQLVEKAKISPEIQLRCFNIIEKLAMKDGGESAEQMGERMWLKQHRPKGVKI